MGFAYRLVSLVTRLRPTAGFIAVNSRAPNMRLNLVLIVLGGVLLGAATVVIALNALESIAQALDVTWLRDVAINTGPIAVAGGAAAGGAAAAAAGAGIGDLPLPAPETPAPPPPPGFHWDPTTKTYTSGPAPEGPPRNAGPDFDDVPWQITFSRWVQVIAGSGETTTGAGSAAKG